MKLIVLGTILFLSFSAVAQEKVIYGEDNRHDVYNYPDRKVVELARSTVALVKKSSLTYKDFYYHIPYTTYQDDKNLCASERFLYQPTAAFCSGFLIAPNKIVTAGHCIKSKSDCEKTGFIFDYHMVSENRFYSGFEKVYSCKRVLGQRLKKVDFAVIELTEEVQGREPLIMSSNEELREQDEMLVIGHPSGLPTKITDEAEVRKVDHSQGFFIANLDTYGGNSGSAVINSRTLEVEGILVRGDTDYIKTSRGCHISNRVSNSSGRGEDVTMISRIHEKGFEGNQTKLTNDSEYRYIWFSWFETCNEFLGSTFQREVEPSYCQK